jgi:exosortase
LCVVAGGASYSFGDTYLAQSVWHGGALLVVVGCVLTVVGHRFLFRFLPAFAVLAFIVPVPGTIRHQIAVPLQTATAAVTQNLFEVAGASVQRAGNLLTINGVDVEIAEACNGLRMIFALTLVSFAFAFGNPLRPYARLLVVAATPLSAIVCNIIRLVPTVWIYGHYPKSIAERVHDASAWVMLGVAFLGMLAVVRVLRWALVPVNRFTLAYD